MPVSREEVEKVAALARLRLSPEEVERFTHQLSRILDHVERFRALDLSGVEGSPPVLEPADTLRGDEPGTTLTRDEALYNAPAPHEGLFAVPRVIPER